MFAGVFFCVITLVVAIAICIDLDILDIPLYIPHAVTPVGDFKPLPSIKFAGKYAVTHHLTADNTERILVDVIGGPEHLLYRAAAVQAGEATLENEAQLPGDIWMSSANGTIYKVAVSAAAKLQPETLDDVVYAGPGRVLGFAFDSEDGMYLCNALQGLMYWTKATGIKLVSNRISKASKIAPGRVISYANSVIVSPATGKVYFTSSGDIPPPYNSGEYDTKAASGMIALTGQREGVLMEYDPTTGETTGLVEGLYFSNGVDIAPDGSFLIYAETFSNSVFKFWLTGPQKGTTQDILGPMPAFVDNVQRVYGTKDSYFVGFPAAASDLLTKGISKSKVFRALMCYVPDSIRYMAAPKIGGGIQFSGSGAVEAVIVDVEGKAVSSTPSGIFLQHNGQTVLFMGSLENPFVMAAPLPT